MVERRQLWNGLKLQLPLEKETIIILLKSESKFGAIYSRSSFVSCRCAEEQIANAPLSHREVCCLIYINGITVFVLFNSSSYLAPLTSFESFDLFIHFLFFFVFFKRIASSSSSSPPEGECWWRYCLRHSILVLVMTITITKENFRFVMFWLALCAVLDRWHHKPPSFQTNAPFPDPINW